MSHSFRIFSPVIMSDGLIGYRHIGNGVEYEVDGKRFTNLNFWDAVDSADLLFWSDLEPPDFPIAGGGPPSQGE